MRIKTPRTTIPKEASLDVFQIYNEMTDVEACTATTVVNQLLVMKELAGINGDAFNVESLRRYEQGLRGYSQFDEMKSANFPETYKAAKALCWIKKYNRIYQSKRDFLYWLSRRRPVATILKKAHAVLIVAVEDNRFRYVDPRDGTVKSTKDFSVFSESYVSELN